MSKFNYFPVMKTTVAELKGYKHLDESSKKLIMPVFELTKSRRSKKNPIGKIEKKIDQLKEILDSKPFILDLTTAETYSNRQISKMLRDHTDGYKTWCEFVIRLKKEGLKPYPTIHYNPFHIPDVKQQITKLAENFDLLAFRVDLFHKESYNFIKQFKGLLSKYIEDKIILILDGAFIPVTKIAAKGRDFVSSIQKIKNIINPKCLICPCSGFPKSVTEEGYGEDETGEFKISEVEIHNTIHHKYRDVLYGDYASIHPKRYDMAGGYWVPRIDVPLDKKVFYYRYRRDEDSYNSYKKAAENIMQDRRYVSAKSWGDEEITHASRGVINGRNPSHWIAVRMNIHITRQAKNQKVSINL